MRAASPALEALLATRKFWVADLWTIALASGTVLRYASADQPVTSGGNVFSAASHLFSRGRCTQKIGMEVDTLDLEVFPEPGDLVDGLPFIQAVRIGDFDNAEALLERAFMPEFGDTSPGALVIFAGRMGDIEAGRTTASITINSHLELLNTRLPRLVYQAPCPHTLYDARCGLARGGFEVPATIGSGATNVRIPLPGLGEADGWAVHGVAEITSGSLAGQTRTVVAHVAGVLTVYPPLPGAPVAGDTVTVGPGCNKTMEACTAFGNLARFGGQPFIPTPDTTT